jgi:predicted dehydrogenase
VFQPRREQWTRSLRSRPQLENGALEAPSPTEFPDVRLHSRVQQMPISEGRFRWGILGTSAIAGHFAAQLSIAGGAKLYAVASRTEMRAKAFASNYGAEVAHGSYEALFADDNVDVVYIGTVADRHYDHCLMALDANKPVLCEKPFAMNAKDALAIAATAKEKNLFCMEAMWMRFSPLVQQVRERIRSGELGTIGFFGADAGYRTADARLRDPQSGRGALLNFGVYGASLAHFLFGPPTHVAADMKPHAFGLDESFSAILRYPTHTATISASIGATMTNEAVVVGNAGRLRLGAPFFNPRYLQYMRIGELSSQPQGPGRTDGLADRLPYGSLLQGSFLAALLRGRGQLVLRPRGANGLRLEAEETMRCMVEGKTESTIIPLAHTVAVMETLDTIRAAWAR